MFNLQLTISERSFGGPDPGCPLPVPLPKPLPVLPAINFPDELPLVVSAPESAGEILFVDFLSLTVSACNFVFSFFLIFSGSTGQYPIDFNCSAIFSISYF